MKAVHMVSWILLIIGGLNWLVVGVAGSSWDLVAKLLGADSILAKIVYILVGLSALISLFTHKKDCKACPPAAQLSAFQSTIE
jgi:uncharacterized membrane protein YuzA (DUF378 family)